MSGARSPEPHYTKISEWVSECGANGMEIAVYQHLAKRLNHSSSTRKVDPSRARLAGDVGLKKPDDVDPYLRALAVLGVIVVHAQRGVRTKYELPLWPPEGYDGPENTHAADRWQKNDPKGYAAWRARRRALVDAAEEPYAAKKRARVAKSKARRNVPVGTGRPEGPDVPVGTGMHVPVGTGTHRPVGTGTNQDDTNDQTNMGDGRRPTTESGGPGEGGFAASGNDALPRRAPSTSIGAVLQAIPGPLGQLLEKDWPRGLPANITTLVENALTAEHRTIDQLGERIARRWRLFGYEEALLSSTGGGLRTGLGVLEELLSPSKCWGNNIDCEDGVELGSERPCPRCEEVRQDRHKVDGEEVVTQGESGHESDTYTAPPYVPPAREDAVGVNQDRAREARAALLARRTARRQ